MKRGVAILVFAVVVAACSGGSEVETTLAPGTTAPPATTSTTTTSTTTTTTTAAPTTTVSVDARRAEIEAAAKDASVRWLRALYFKDTGLLFDVAGSQAVYEAGLTAIENDSVAFIAEPTAENTSVTLNEVVLDREDCVAGEVTLATASVDADLEPVVEVWFPQDDGRFKIARTWGSGTSAQTVEPDCDFIIRDFQP